MDEAIEGVHGRGKGMRCQGGKNKLVFAKEVLQRGWNLGYAGSHHEG